MDRENSKKLSTAQENWDYSFDYKLIIKLELFLRLFHKLTHLVLTEVHPPTDHDTLSLISLC